MYLATVAEQLPDQLMKDISKLGGKDAQKLLDTLAKGIATPRKPWESSRTDKKIQHFHCTEGAGFSYGRR